MSSEGKWQVERRKQGNFLIPRRAMEKIFKGYFLNKIQQYHQQKLLKIEDENIFHELIQKVSFKKWSVYVKASFGGPQQIMEYLGRYTHKVTISTHRIKAITDDSITFSYKDYQDKHKQKLMTLSHEEFLRRFEQHILPKGFVKIRHSGFLSHQHKGERLKLICEQLQIATPPKKVALPVAVLAAMKYGVDIKKCSMCKDGRMELVATYVNVANKGVELVQVDQFRPRCRASPRISLHSANL